MSSAKEITITVITRNEETNVEALIASIKRQFTIIVVDSYSNDRTPEIVQSSDNVRFFQRDWSNFSEQKQFAASLAPTDWILNLDADERITKELIQELKTLNLDPTVGYEILRTNYFLGKKVKHSGWNPDPVLRLFNKRFCHYNGRPVHESITGFDSIIRLHGKIEHYPYSDKKDIQKKIWLYANLGAPTVNSKVYLPSLRASWAIFRTLILKLGIIDGITGIQISLMNGKSTYLKYAIARSRQQNKKLKSSSSRA